MIIRAILLQPDWLFLDETTASLDEGLERRAYHLLKTWLPRTTMVSVGHRSTLRALHSCRIDLVSTKTVDSPHARIGSDLLARCK
jgi:putative ATP-binding cassette transporter